MPWNMDRGCTVTWPRHGCVELVAGGCSSGGGGHDWGWRSWDLAQADLCLKVSMRGTLEPIWNFEIGKTLPFWLLWEPSRKDGPLGISKKASIYIAKGHDVMKKLSCCKCCGTVVLWGMVNYNVKCYWNSVLSCHACDVHDAFVMSMHVMSMMRCIWWRHVHDGLWYHVYKKPWMQNLTLDSRINQYIGIILYTYI